MEQFQIYYADGDMVILDNLADFQELEHAGMILSIIVVAGRLRVDIGGETAEVRARDILICPPKTEMDNLFSSPDFRGMIFGMSYAKFQRTVGPAAGESVWSVMMYAREHPLYHMTDAEMRIGTHIFHLFQEKLAGPQDFYYKEVMQSLMVTAFYEISVIIERKRQSDQGSRYRQKDLIFRRFLELLGEADGRRGSVADYARALCISPKYLSAAVKAASGKSALAWIHEYTVESISRQLRLSGRSVKEIANEYGFTSLSAFGKFVKTHLGASPREFRSGLTAD